MQRRSHYDVTNTIRVSHPQDVAAELKRLFASLYPQQPLDALDRAVELFSRLYAGYPSADAICVRAAVTLALRSLLKRATPIPIGPAPTTSTFCPSATPARRTAWAPIARNSTIAACSSVIPFAFFTSACGTLRYSLRPPSRCTK